MRSAYNYTIVSSHTKNVIIEVYPLKGQKSLIIIYIDPIKDNSLLSEN